VTVHVVGGGIAGLVAAITAAEEGAPVVLHEASGRLGGRALAGPVGGGDGRPGLNLGPRVLHTDGVIWRWARRQGVTLPTRRPRLGGTRLLAGPAVAGRGPRLPLAASALLLPTVSDRPAPVDVDFRAWATDIFGPERATLMCRLAGLFTYHHDPGATSARFAWERYRRTFVLVHHVRYVDGGWSTLVDALADRAAALGVEVRTGEPARAGELPDGPTVVATSLRSAGRVLGRDLRWPSARTALLDVELAGPPAWPETVADVRDDLVTCCLVDRTLRAASGTVLLQAQLGLAPGATLADGVARIEATFDAVAPGWRDRVTWRRQLLVADSSGAVDPPGTTWRDRPAVDQGDDVFLAGDAVAAPGMLAEVSVNSAVRAGRLAAEARRRRAWAPGWPSVALTPERRLAVLAAALPGARLRAIAPPGPAAPPAPAGRREPGPAAAPAPAGRREPPEPPEPPEPADETGEGYRLRTGPRGAHAVAIGADGGRSVLRWRRPWREAVGLAVARVRPSDVSGRRPGALDNR